MIGGAAMTIWGAPCEPVVLASVQRRMRLRTPEGEPLVPPEPSDVLRMVADVSGVPETDILDTAMRSRATVAARRVLFGLLRASLAMSYQSIAEMMVDRVDGHSTVRYACAAMARALSVVRVGGGGPPNTMTMTGIDRHAVALWRRCELVMAEIGWQAVMSRINGGEGEAAPCR